MRCTYRRSVFQARMAAASQCHAPCKTVGRLQVVQRLICWLTAPAIVFQLLSSAELHIACAVLAGLAAVLHAVTCASIGWCAPHHAQRAVTASASAGAGPASETHRRSLSDSLYVAYGCRFLSRKFRRKERALLRSAVLGGDVSTVALAWCASVWRVAGAEIAAVFLVTNALTQHLLAYLASGSGGPGRPQAFKHADGGTYSGEWAGLSKHGLGVYRCDASLLHFVRLECRVRLLPSCALKFTAALRHTEQTCALRCVRHGAATPLAQGTKAPGSTTSSTAGACITTPTAASLRARSWTASAAALACAHGLLATPRYALFRARPRMRAERVVRVCSAREPVQPWGSMATAWPLPLREWRSIWPAACRCAGRVLSQRRLSAPRRPRRGGQHARGMRRDGGSCARR